MHTAHSVALPLHVAWGDGLDGTTHCPAPAARPPIRAGADRVGHTCRPNASGLHRLCRSTGFGIASPAPGSLIQ